MGLKLAVLLSGGGTTLQNILDRIDEGVLNAEVVCVISSRANVYGLERARNHGVPATSIVRKEFPDNTAFNQALWNEIRGYQPDLVVLAGFMSLLEVPADYAGRIINVHPALIPAFCGQGMYGHHVHEAVLQYGVKISGATVHFVDDQYDHGPIIVQGCVPVLEDDTADSLADRVQAKERELYIQALQLYAAGRLKVEGNKVQVLPAGS